LTDYRHDGASDQVPVCADVQWHDRLDVQYFLRAVERPGVEIGIALERNADEIRDRILRFLRQIFIFRRVARIPAACRGESEMPLSNL
jgi:hypothetical protein